MQTLTVGSFVNLDNREKVEALKLTAALVAGKAADAVAEQQLTETAVTNLANNFWEKAEYVTREPERRGLQQIFVDEFIARFIQSKPFAVGENQVVATSHDEYSGLVKTDAQPSEITENSTPAPPTENELIESSSEANQAETNQSEIPESNKAVETTELKLAVTTENSLSAATKTSTANLEKSAMEPFEFDRCSLTLNLNLLPAETNNSRMIIVSTASHNLPPEIELLEITDGNDVNQIAELVRRKLVRFRQTLPAKYIEQLRQSKTKATVKKSSVSKVATPNETNEKSNDSSPALQTSGEQKSAAIRKNDLSEGNTDPNAASARAMPPVAASRKKSATNTVQPSLF